MGARWRGGQGRGNAFGSQAGSRKAAENVAGLRPKKGLWRENEKKHGLGVQPAVEKDKQEAADNNGGSEGQREAPWQWQPVATSWLSR